MPNYLVNQRLDNKTTTGIGGMVAYFFEPLDLRQFIQAILFCKDKAIPFIILAGGSNLIFADTSLNYNQAVISTLKLTRLDENDSFLVCQAGVKLQFLVDFCQEKNLQGLVGLNRVPGTIGGAVVGNAGAYGIEIKEVVDWVEYLDTTDLQLHRISNTECKFAYRDSIFKQNRHWLVYQIGLKLEQLANINQITEQQQKYNQIAQIRDNVYPADLKSPGSVFKNILFDTLADEIKKHIPAEWVMYGNKLPVGKLLEEVGAKGYKIGDIGMRPTHANIMENYGAGKYADVKQLIQSLQKKVEHKFGILIEPEIRLIE